MTPKQNSLQMKEKICTRCAAGGAVCQTNTARKSCDRCAKRKEACSLVKTLARRSAGVTASKLGLDGVTNAEASTSRQPRRQAKESYGSNRAASTERDLVEDTNERSSTEWEALVSERKAKQRATEEVLRLRSELNHLRRNLDARYVKKELHEQQTSQLQGKIQKLQEDLLTEEKNTLSLQLRVDHEVDKLEDILSSGYLKESDQRVRQMVRESHKGLKQIVREIKAARPSDSQVMQNILSITKRGFQQDTEEDDEDAVRASKHQRTG